MPYYFQLISLKDCPFSKNAEILLKNVNHKLTKINRQEIEKWRNDNIKTFPQIYLKKDESTSTLLIGGFDEINRIVNIINEEGDIDKKKQKIKKYHQDFSDKSILRIIELLLI